MVQGLEDAKGKEAMGDCVGELLKIGYTVLSARYHSLDLRDRAETGNAKETQRHAHR